MENLIINYYIPLPKLKSLHLLVYYQSHHGDTKKEDKKCNDSYHVVSIAQPALHQSYSNPIWCSCL